MPSAIVGNISGGALLVSGDIYSGSFQPVGGIQLRLSPTAPGTVYVGLPNLSGDYPTITSGGALASGGGLLDAMPLAAGDSYFVPRSRLVSGIQTIRCVMTAASSGGRMFWEPM